MENTIAQCIRNYIENHYSGGLIGISDLADHCGKSEGEIYVELLTLKQLGEIEIIKRFFCPEGHSIALDDVPFCHECDFRYSDLYISTLVYVQPLSYSSQKNFVTQINH